MSACKCTCRPWPASLRTIRSCHPDSPCVDIVSVPVACGQHVVLCHPTELLVSGAAGAGSAEDKAACTAIWQDAERWRMGSNNPNVTLDDTWFPRGFGTDEAVIADRMWFVCAPDGEPVATTTSWYDRDTRGTRGVVHYVGMKKVYAGRGLSKPLFTRVLLRLRELGHTDCHLGTSTGRVEAINLYVKYGFMPNPRSATEYRAWRE